MFPTLTNHNSFLSNQYHHKLKNWLSNLCLTRHGKCVITNVTSRKLKRVGMPGFCWPIIKAMCCMHAIPSALFGLFVGRWRCNFIRVQKQRNCISSLAICFLTPSCSCPFSHTTVRRGGFWRVGDFCSRFICLSVSILYVLI